MGQIIWNVCIYKNRGVSHFLYNNFQGFNTGIVLYHLENMRKSHLYNKYVHPETGGKEIIALANHYEYASHLGDQVSFNIWCEVSHWKSEFLLWIWWILATKGTLGGS